MPRIQKARRSAAQDLPSKSAGLAWWHLKHLLRVSLQDTCNFLQAWTHTRQTESLHQARVAWRRQKCLLKFYKPLLPELPERGKAALRYLWQLTGQLRNLDVALENTLPTWHQSHPNVGANEWPALLQLLQQDRLRARHALAQEIAKPHVGAALQQLRNWNKRLKTAHLKLQDRPFRQWAKQRLQRLQKNIKNHRHARSPERRHQGRILLKQERYALESLLTNRPDKKLRAQLRRVRKKQIAWGHDQDMQMVLNLIEGHEHCPKLAQAWRASMGNLDSSQ